MTAPTPAADRSRVLAARGDMYQSARALDEMFNLLDVPDQPSPTGGDAGPRPAPCQSLRFMRGEAVRCGQPEDGDAHDPLGPPDAHPYDPLPADVPDQPDPTKDSDDA